MIEKQVEQYLVRRVKGEGGICLKWVSPGQVGVPDRIIFFQDEVIFAELKRPGATARKSQKKLHARLIELGQEVVVLDSFEEIDHLLETRSRHGV